MMCRPLILSINAVVIIIDKNLYLNYEQPLHSSCENKIAADKIMYLCLTLFTFQRFDFNESIDAATCQPRPNAILLFYDGIDKDFDSFVPFCFSDSDFPAEMEKQLSASNPKVLFCSPEIYATAREAATNIESDLKIVCIKMAADEVIPHGAIDFAQIIDINSESMTLSS